MRSGTTWRSDVYGRVLFISVTNCDMNSRVSKLRAVINDPASSDNEKEIARRILAEYKSQGIDIDEEEELEFNVFKFSTKFEYQFLFQIVWNVL